MRQGVPQKAIHEARKTKEIGDARNREHLLKKGTASLRAAVWDASREAIGVGLPKSCGIHISPPCDLDTRHRAIGLNIFPARFHC